MGVLKRKTVKGSSPSASGACAPAATKAKPHLTVVLRRQTSEEEHQFNSAFELLLREMVRQYLEGEREE